MEIIIFIAAAIGGAIVVVLLVGAFLPKDHVASKVCYLQASPEELWGLITDFAAQPAWRSKLKSVEKLPSRNGNEVWKECEVRNRCLSFETLEAMPPRRLVRRIVDEGLPFGGSWTFEITPEGRGSQLQITEHGEVRNIVFRFVSKFVIGHTATMDAYIESLKHALRNREIAA